MCLVRAVFTCVKGRSDERLIRMYSSALLYRSCLEEGLSQHPEHALPTGLTLPKLPGLTCLYPLVLSNTRDTHQTVYTNAVTDKAMISLSNSKYVSLHALLLSL